MSLSKVIKKYQLVNNLLVLDTRHLKEHELEVNPLPSKEEEEKEQLIKDKENLELERQKLEEWRQNLEHQQEQIEQRLRELEHQREELEKGKESIIQEGQNKARQLEEQAQQEKEKIIQQAYQEAEKIVNQAETQKFEIKEKAYQEGYQKGWEEGKIKGVEEGRKELNQLGKSLQDIIIEINNKRAEIIQKAEPKIVDLALAIARKIIQTEVRENKEIIRELVRESIQRLKNREKIVVRVNPADLESLREYKNDLMMIFSEIDDLEIKEDRSISPGGCVVETEATTVDSRLELRMGKIEREIDNLK